MRLIAATLTAALAATGALNFADAPSDVEVRDAQGVISQGNADAIDITGLDVSVKGSQVVVRATHVRPSRAQIDRILVSYDVTGNGVPDYEYRVNYNRVRSQVLGMGSGGGQWFGGYLPVEDCDASTSFRPGLRQVVVRMPLSCLGDPQSVAVSYLAEDATRNYGHKLDAAPGVQQMTDPVETR